MNRLFTLLLVAAAFSACKKEEKTVTPAPIDTPIPYLSKVTYWNAKYQQQMLKDSFLLNSDGDLAFAGIYDQYYTVDEFVYDKGNLVEVTGYMYDDGAIHYRFEYDASNRVSKRISLGRGAALASVSYSYDEYNRLAKEERHDELQGGQLLSSRTFTYSNPGTLNPVSITETGSNPDSITEYVYTYDNKINPYTTLPKMVYYLMDNGQPGTNNILSTTIRKKAGSVTNIYTYTSAGLPINKQTPEVGETRYYYTNK